MLVMGVQISQKMLTDMRIPMGVQKLHVRREISLIVREIHI